MQLGMRKQPPMPPDEAQEYLAKLQGGKIQLAPEAGELEREAFDAVRECGQHIRELTTQRGDIEKQIEALQVQVRSLGDSIAAKSGEMGGYARLLVSAEGARRKVIAEAARIAAEEKAAEEKAAEEKAAEETAPAKVEETAPAKVEETAPAKVEETAPAKVEERDKHKKRLQAPPMHP